MESALISTFIKNKSYKSENQSQQSNNHTLSEGFERSHTNEQQNHHAYLMSYLILQKNLGALFQKCKKILTKHKRIAFRKFFLHKKSNRNDKASQNCSQMVQFSKPKKQIQKGFFQTSNPQLHPREIVMICARQAEFTMQKLFHSFQKMRLKAIIDGWMHIKMVGCSWAAEVNGLPQKSTLYVIKNQSQESEHMGKGNSRLSNKRKTAKCRQDHKQNSHLSVAELTLQNQRLRNELLQDEEERYAFIDQLGQLLDYHEKYLAQGSTTTRTKKHK